MTEQEIIEGNKLIAHFMGWEYSTYEHLPNRMYSKDKGYPEGHSLGIDAKNMKYHSSWDWLMPVIEKIENLPTEVGEEYQYSITGNGISITLFDDGSGIISSSVNVIGKSKLSSTWEVVAEFIKWYNQNKK